ncbi:MAG: hypothetical protein E7477_02450 [Ruminococcaceae bacterium]|nr:hypothetical protein [Oscillospiraceae bacterium]
MKKTTKLLALITSVLIASTACAQQSDEIFDLDLNEKNESVATDLNGFTMTQAITTATLFGDQSNESIFGFNAGTLFADEAIKREADIEEKYNCHIEPFYNTDGASIDKFNSHSLSGVFYCDVILGRSDILSSSIKPGLFQSINSLSEYIDYTDSEKWGTRYMLESMCYDGELFGILPAAWPELNYSSFGYAFVANMNLASTLGIPDLRETVENKEWTWEKFEETLVAGTVIEGTETKTYGMSAHPPYLGEMLLRSNGDAMIKGNEDGGYYWGYTDNQALKAIEEFRKVYNGEFAYTFDQVNTEPDPVVNTFVDGKATLTIVDTEQLFGYNGKISKNVENYAILHAPTGPDVEPGRIFSVHESMRSMICFSVLGKNIEASAFIIDKLYEPLEGFETKDDIKDYMTHNYFFDDRDANVFFEMFENTEYNYFIVGMRLFNESVTARKNTSIIEIIESYKTKNQNIIDQEAVSPRETMKELWPE